MGRFNHQPGLQDHVKVKVAAPPEVCVSSVNVLVVVENWTQSGPSLRQSVLQVALSLTTTGASIRSGLLHLVTAFARSLPELLFPGSQGLTELRIIRTSGLQVLDVPISTSWLSTIVHKRRTQMFRHLWRIQVVNSNG